MFDDFFSNIYLFKKKRGLAVSNWFFHNFNNWGISKQKIYLVLCISNNNPMVFNFQTFRQISIKFSLFLAKPFVN